MNVQQIIEDKLRQGLEPQTLTVHNVSHQHHGHAGSPNSGQSHFEVRVVAEKFRGMGKVARHKAVYALLRDEMAGPIHALALTTLSPDEL